MAIDDSEGDAAGVGKPAMSAETRAGGEASGGAAGGRNPTLESVRESVDDDLGTGDMRDSLESTGTVADRLSAVVDERTVRVNPDLDEDAFFTAEDGGTTVVNRYDLERAVPREKKSHFREVERYWVNEPYAFVIILHSEKENEKKYYLIEPHLSPIEEDLKEFLAKKLKTAIKYSSDQIVVQGSEDARAGVIERETHELLERYDLYDEGARPDDGGVLDGLKSIVGSEDSGRSDGAGQLQGAEIRPEPTTLLSPSRMPPSSGRAPSSYRSYRSSSSWVSRSMTPARASSLPWTTIWSLEYLIAVFSFLARKSLRSSSIGERCGSMR